MPVSGSTLAKILENKGMADAALAKEMDVTPPTVRYWKQCAEIPHKRIAGLEAVLGPLKVKESRRPKSWMQNFKRKYKALEREYRISAQDLADRSQLNGVTVTNILNGVTDSPWERTMEALDEGLEILRASLEEHGSSIVEEPISFQEGIVKIIEVDKNREDIYKINTSGVYILYGDHNVTPVPGGKMPKFHGAPERVGQAGSIGSRMRQYKDIWWYRGVAWIAYVEVKDKERRQWLEAILIRLLNPQFNIQKPN